MRSPILAAATLAALAAATAAPAPASAQAVAQPLAIPSGTYAVDRTHASVVWKLSHFGYSTYTGFLDRAAIDASVDLDAADVAKSTLKVTVDGQRIETLHDRDADPRHVDFNAEIESDAFLNTAAHPQITFVSTGIEVTGGSTATITGDLTLNGQTHPVSLAATMNKAEVHPMTGLPTFGISAAGTLDRTAFGVTNLAGIIGNDVTLEIQAEFIKTN